ncbi:MAG: LacI family DNA-binding transcriptional regulator [Pontiella sp.]
MADRKKKNPNKGANQGSRRITHSDIAKALGVSQMTISLALRNHPRISEATRNRVHAKAAELNYHPDPMLSALSSYRLSNQKKIRQATLAWINPFRDPAHLRIQHEFDLYWKGACEAANHFGFHLEEFTTSTLSLARMNTIFKTRNIQGIVLASLGGANLTGDWEKFPWQDYMAVRFGLSTDYPQVHRITSSQVRNTYIAFNKIVEKGYQRIGFCGHRSPTRFFSAGFAFAQYSLPDLCRIPPLFFMENMSKAQQIDHLKCWMKTTRPDAILTERPAIPEMLRELGYTIPGDVALATLSLHDTPINAGIDQNPEEIGRAAVRTVTSLLNEQSFGIPSIQKETLIDGKWMDGSMLPDKA